jgi:DNA-3-methyladenine glycosylase
MRKIPRSFYQRNTIDIAQELLGCEFISNIGGIKTGGIIVETEAYRGPDDPACHAFRGLTNRNRVMFGDPGYLYVYFTYGNHFMANIVCEQNGFPAAVLIRGIEPRYGIETMAARRETEELTNIASGPGKLARALGLTTANNGTDLIESIIYLRGPAERNGRIMASPRIGIGERGSEKLWRFFFDGNPHVSKGTKNIRDNTIPVSKARQQVYEI